MWGVWDVSCVGVWDVSCVGCVGCEYEVRDRTRV